MHKSHQNFEDLSAAKKTGRLLRQARRKNGLTIATLAERIGRPREWLNRVELGYSDQAEYPPANLSDIQALIEVLSPESFNIPVAELKNVAQDAINEFQTLRNKNGQINQIQHGKQIQTQLILGEKQIVKAINELIAEQYSDAIIRNTGIKTPGNYTRLTESWQSYRKSLGEFLETNPNSLFKRVEFVSDKSQLQKAKDADAKLAGGRKIGETHNAKIKFFKHNPMQLHIFIGQREAIMALPHASGQAGSNIAILVRDKIFVDALRQWYDEVLWDAPGDKTSVDFKKFDESFKEIREMYGF